MQKNIFSCLIATQLSITEKYVAATLALIDEGCTIPFIARYRKEATGALDDEQLRALFERLNYLRNLEEKKQQVLSSIEEQGKLTPLGEKTLQTIEAIYATANKRLGDLTTVGERQHHGIGRRMTQNFPEIFKTKNVAIDARSTVVVRCILSMVAECERPRA